jgi:hypothetical protein
MRLYSIGEIQVPSNSALNMTPGISVTDEGTLFLLTAIESLKTDYGNDIIIVKLEGLNRLFQPAITGAISEYS